MALNAWPSCSHRAQLPPRALPKFFLHLCLAQGAVWEMKNESFSHWLYACLAGAFCHVVWGRSVAKFGYTQAMLLVQPERAVFLRTNVKGKGNAAIQMAGMEGLRGLSTGQVLQKDSRAS